MGMERGNCFWIKFGWSFCRNANELCANDQPFVDRARSKQKERKKRRKMDLLGIASNEADEISVNVAAKRNEPKQVLPQKK